MCSIGTMDTMRCQFGADPRLKPKAGELPASVKYFSAVDTPDVWLAYPWECDSDIEEHDALRAQNPAV